MRPTHRKIPGARPAFFALVEDQGRPVFICSHTHPTRKKANACARQQIKHLPRSGPAALRLLRQSWDPRQVPVPSAEDGRPVLRRSFVESFLQCVQHVPDGSPEAEWGGVVHDAIYRYWQLCVATREESRLGDVDRIVREAYFRPGATPEPARYEEARELVYEFVSSRTLELSKLLVVERRPAIEITLRADGGWCWLVGTCDRIDRVDGEDPDDPPRLVRIRDYKTGWQATGGRRLDGVVPSNGSTRVVPHEFQRRFYAQLAFLDPRLGRDLEAVETEIDHVRYHGEPEVIVYERGELDGWWQDVLWALALRWQNRSAPPTGCAACEHCAIRRECGASTSEARGVPADEAEARALVEDWIRTKQRADSQRLALQSFMQERAPMVVNGLEVGFLRPRQPTWRAAKERTLDIVATLNAAGLAGERAMFTAIDPKLVPDVLKAPLVEAGVARWDPGSPAFKARKSGTDE